MGMLIDLGKMALELGVDELVIRVCKERPGRPDAMVKFSATVDIPEIGKEACYDHAVEVRDCAYREGVVLDNFMHQCRVNLGPYLPGGGMAKALILSSAPDSPAPSSAPESGGSGDSPPPVGEPLEFPAKGGA